MRKRIYFVLTCLIIIGVIYGAFQLYFSYRALEEDYPYQSLSPYTSEWFEAEITDIGEHGIKATVIGPAGSEQNVMRTIYAPISEKTIIKDKDENLIDISSLASGQKVRICVSSGVIYEDCVRTDTLHHIRYIGCHEIQVMD